MTFHVLGSVVYKGVFHSYMLIRYYSSSQGIWLSIVALADNGLMIWLVCVTVLYRLV